MKLKSLILGSIAAAGLSTAGFAADLGVLTSLDVCDELGLSGLTISSDTNCLQISGGVKYEFRFGDYRASDYTSRTPFGNEAGTLAFGTTDVPLADTDPLTGESSDWHSKVEAWLKFVGTASSDFGAAKAVIKIKQTEAYRFRNEAPNAWGDNDDALIIDEAYVAIGDTTVIMAGKKSSIANFGDSEPFNFLKTFGYGAVDVGVGVDNDDTPGYLGGHVIQIVSDLGNGVNVGLGLENLDGENGGNAATAGSLVGVIGYANESVTAHLTGIAAGILDGEVDQWVLHTGVTATFDAFKVRAALGYIRNDLNDVSDLHALVSGQASFDMFTLALSGEYMSSNVAGVTADGFGIGGSIGATVTEGVAINLGARYFTAELAPLAGADNDAAQVAVQLVADITETLKVTGEIGAYFNDVTIAGADDSVYYGSASLAWAPGGGFTSSIAADVYSNDAYRVTFKAAKSFE